MLDGGGFALSLHRHCCDVTVGSELPKRVTRVNEPKYLIVEDHPLMAKALARELARVTSDSRIEIAMNLGTALSFLEKHAEPLWIFLDLELPDSQGLSNIEKIKRAAPTARIAIVSGHDHPQTIRSTISAGAAGFIPKRYETEVLAEAMRSLLTKGFFVPDEVEEIESRTSTQLTRRESQILLGLAAGKSNKAIAKELGVGPDNVKYFVRELFRKLGVRNRTAAVVAARERGLV